jgi:hypothetical protein
MTMSISKVDTDLDENNEYDFTANYVDMNFALHFEGVVCNTFRKWTASDEGLGMLSFWRLKHTDDSEESTIIIMPDDSDLDEERRVVIESNGCDLHTTKRAILIAINCMVYNRYGFQLYNQMKGIEESPTGKELDKNARKVFNSFNHIIGFYRNYGLEALKVTESEMLAIHQILD